MIGKINSVETFGTVDGPGIRYVVFLQGCNYRCQYCHNPETWEMCQGIEQSVDDLVSDILRYKRYIEGVTVSGGEPLLQIDFVRKLFARVKSEGLTTCLDTNGGVFDDTNDEDYREYHEYRDSVLNDPAARQVFINKFVDKAFIRFADMNEDCEIEYNRDTILVDGNNNSFDAISVYGSDSYDFGEWPTR